MPESAESGGVRPGEEKPARLAWCYGDPGIAAALLYAARCVGNARWEAAALDLARVAARRRLPGSEVADAGLCHGSVELGHLFHRIHQATGDETCGEAARYWFRHALAWRPAGDWATGFPAWLTADPGHFQELSGFLMGASGVGLALLAATQTVTPSWDRTLLLDIPPRPGLP